MASILHGSARTTPRVRAAFADLPKNRNGPTAYWSGGHIFGRTCADNDITHKLTKPYHPWTNGQAERMNRTIKDATLKVFHYPDIESLKAHVLAFVKTYNFAKHLKALGWKTPFETISHAWTTDPSIFKINPRHLIPGPNTLTKDFDIPVVLLAFNRPQLTQRVFDVISTLRPSRLFVVCDGARSDHSSDEQQCAQVRDIISAVDWPCQLARNFSTRNLGCGLRVSSGLDWVFRSVDRAIILEDDCLPCLDFFTFCSEMLTLYEHDNRVGTIAGTNLISSIKRFSGSYVFTKYFACWGWATWRRAWASYDWRMADLSKTIDRGVLRSALGRDDAADYFIAAFNRTLAGEIDSWAYPMLFHCLINNWLHIVPTRNLVSNIGFGAASTHTTSDNSPDANLPIEGLLGPIEHNPYVVGCRAFDNILERHHLGLTAE